MPDSDTLEYTVEKILSPRCSEVSLSKTGALKVLIFWAIDGLGFLGIKRKQFQGIGGGLDAG